MTKGVQIRIDQKLKKDAEKVLDQMGLDMPTAIRIFLKKVVTTQRIPFPLSVPNLSENGFTPEFEDEVLKAAQEDKQYGPFESSEALIKSLNTQNE